jgi:tetratricopeptide (TPR) repeat protein
MKNSKLITVAALVFALTAALVLSAAYSQEEPKENATATEAQKKVIPPCKCNGIIQDIVSSKDEAALRNLIEDAFSEPCAYENYEKFVADARTALAGSAVENKDYLNYAIALARIDQLSALSKDNDIEAGRLYMSVSDKYFNEAIECLDTVGTSTRSKSLAIDNNLLRFIVFKEKFQPQKSDAVFDLIASQIAKYSDDAKANKKELENIFERMKRLGLSKYAIKLKILYASKVDPETAREVLDELKVSADQYFEQNDMKAAANLYEQYMASAPDYYNKEEMGARIMEVGEKYFTAGKYRDAKKYYSIYMEKYSDLPPADYCSYKLALSSYYMKDHIKTISQLESFLEKYKTSAWFDKAFEMLARVYYENLPRDKALENIQSIIDKYYRKDTGDYARVLMAMLYYGAKNYDSAEDVLKKIEPSSSYSYTAQMIMDDIKEIKKNKTAPAFGTDATDTYKVWDPYQGIDVKIVPTVAGSSGEKGAIPITTESGVQQIEVNKGAKIQFAIQGLVDEDRFNEYTVDKDDQSRLPKMIREETEKDLLSLRWSVDGGNFTDDKETDAKVWQAPKEPGTYKMTIKVDDFGLVRVPNKGTKKDLTKDTVLNIVVK